MVIPTLSTQQWTASTWEWCFSYVLFSSITIIPLSLLLSSLPSLITLYWLLSPMRQNMIYEYGPYKSNLIDCWLILSCQVGLGCTVKLNNSSLSSMLWALSIGGAPPLIPRGWGGTESPSNPALTTHCIASSLKLPAKRHKRADVSLSHSQTHTPVQYAVRILCLFLPFTHNTDRGNGDLLVAFLPTVNCIQWISCFLPTQT